MELESLPEGWELKELGEITRIEGGGTPNTRIKEYYKGNIPFVIPSDLSPLKNFFISAKDIQRRITTEAIEKSSTKLLPPGTVLMSSRATIGLIAIPDFPVCTNQGFKNFICGKELNNLYLAYYLKSIKEKIEGLAGSTTFKEVSKRTIQNLEIPLPPLEEQKKIVEILQFADYLKERRREAIKLIDKIVMSVFYDMFGDPATNPKGWEVKKIGNIIEDIKSGFAYGKFNKERGIPQLRPYNITEDGKLGLSTLKYVPDTKKNIEGYYLKTGDIIFNNTNSPELVGKTTIFKSDLDCVFSNHLTRIRLDETKATPAYIKQLFNYLWLKRVFQNRCHQWVNQASINNKNLRELEILLPPLDLQQEFTEIVSKLEDKRKQMEEAEEKLEMLYQILLRQAFTGKLTEEWRMRRKEGLD